MENVQLLWRTAWWFLKKLEIELPSDPAIPLLKLYPREVKAGNQIFVHLCSYQHYSQQSRGGGYQNVHQQMSGQAKSGYTCNEVLFSHETEGKSNTWYNMDDT